MRIAEVTSTISRSGGGVSEVVRLQAQAIADRAEVIVESLQSPHDEQDRKAWPSLDIRVHKGFGPARYAFAPGILLSLLRSKVDLVHVHGLWQFHCAAVYIWSLLTGKPYVVTPHGMLEPWIVSRSSGVKKLVSRLYQDRFLKRAAAFQILTAKERQDIAPYVRGQTISEIPNYVAPFVASTEPPSWWRRTFDGKTIYLFFGRIHEKKACRELAEAWASLCRQDPAFAERSALVFCGWNDGVEGFEGFVQNLDAEFGNVLFAGPQYGQQKLSSLSAASFFVLPSKSEGLPMAILEAWSAGLPVIMTPECNLPQGFASRAALETGSRTDEIEASLRQADHMSIEERRDMGRRGIEIVRKEYSRERVGDALLALYAICIGGKERASVAAREGQR